jgi:hypothetical protein
MPVPLSADPNVIGRIAVKSAPRLAAMLMASHHSGVPLTGTPHRVGASPDASLIMSSSNPLAKWSERVVAAVDAARAAAAAARETRAPAMKTAAVRTPVSPIADLYRRLLGEAPASSRPRSLDEQAEAARPAEAGRSAPVLEKAAQVSTDRTTELVALAAVVVGVGYGDRVDRANTGGDFDVTVFQNLMRAADVIASGQSISSLDPIRLRAVLTAGLQSSNSAFLSHVKDSGRATSVLMAASRLASDGAKVASEFLVGGKFNEATFSQKTTGVLASAAQMVDATPVGAKAMLLLASAEKAKDLLNEVEQQGGARAVLRSKVFQSISDRMAELNSRQAPADQPTAPGVR